MPMSDDLSQGVLEYYFSTEASPLARPTTWFVALHTGNPGRTGDDEVTSGDDSAYARKAVVFDVSDSEPDGIFEATNDADVTMNAAGAGASYTITHISIWTAVTGGTMLASLPLPVPLPTVAGTINAFAIGDITIKGI